MTFPLAYSAAVVFVAVSLASAQTPASQTFPTQSLQARSDQPSQRPPEVVSFGFGPAGTMVPLKQHAPFSAVFVTEFQQVLSDGTSITKQNEEVVMRDGMGRVYRARTVKSRGRELGEPRLMITITDPVQHVQYLCTPLRTCQKFTYRQRSAPFQPHLRANDPDVTVEDLGSADFSGVATEGRRVTRMIPEGTVGNDRPFSTIDERWHSSELDIDMQLKRVDPRVGTRTVSLTQIALGEPDPKYFQVPEGYSVRTMSRLATDQVSPMTGEGEPAFPPSLPPSH